MEQCQLKWNRGKTSNFLSVYVFHTWNMLIVRDTHERVWIINCRWSWNWTGVKWNATWRSQSSQIYLPTHITTSIHINQKGNLQKTINVHCRELRWLIKFDFLSRFTWFFCWVGGKMKKWEKFSCVKTIFIKNNLKMS